MTLLPLIDVNPQTPPGFENIAGKLLGWLAWAGGLAVVAGIIMVGISLAITNERGSGGERVKQIGAVVMGAGLIVSAGSIAAVLTGV